MAKIHAYKTIVGTKKIIKVYEYMSKHYDSCKELVQAIEEKSMSKDDKKVVLNSEELTLREKFKYKTFIREHESILKDIKKLGYEEFMLGLDKFMDFDHKYNDSIKVSALLNNLVDFHKRLLELGFSDVVDTTASDRLDMTIRFEENFTTDGEVDNYRVVEPGLISTFFGNEEQKLDVTLRGASFLITNEICRYRDEVGFVKKAYVVGNYPNKKNLDGETSDSIAEKKNPFIKDITQDLKEEDYSKLYSELYDDRIDFFQDLRKMRKEAKSLGIFKEITKGVDDKSIEELMDPEDLKLLKALIIKNRKPDLKSKVNKLK